MSSTRLRRFPRFAGVAGGLALMLAGCGTLSASRPDNSGGRPVSGSHVITSIDLRTGSAGRRFVLPALSAGAADTFTMDTFMLAASAPVACVTCAASTASGLAGPPVIECVDLATGRVGKPVTMSGRPLAVALAPDGRTAYAALGNMLVPIDLVTGSTGRPIPTPMLGIGAIAITAGGRTAYVGNLKPAQPHSGVVLPVDLVTGTARTAIGVPSYPFSITDIVIARDGRTAYAAANSSVIPIDLTTQSADKPIALPAGVRAVILAA